jgi:anti-anti-sigma regulatory factor
MRVEGKGSFQNSPLAKRCFQTMIDNGTRLFVVDLERCPIMDSTFLGTLTGAALNLRELGDGKVTVVNGNARNQQLLRSLGLDHILDVDRDGTSYQAERREVCRELDTCKESPEACNKADQTGHVLEAHKALILANPQNANRFKDVIEFLEKELQTANPPAPA